MEYEYGLDFKLFCIENDIGEVINGVIHIDQAAFDKIREHHSIITVERGGLVLGNSHANGGIHMLTFSPENCKYEYLGEMEGMEYITNELYTPLVQEFYQKINDDQNYADYIPDPEFKIPENCVVYDVSQNELQVVFYVKTNRMIINANSTQKNIKTLVDAERIFDFL